MKQHPGLVVRRIFVSALMILFCLLNASCGRRNFELTTDTTSVCTADQNGEWERVVNLTQRVRGQDPAGYFIADFPAEKFGILNINNWHPLSGYKETLCGELHHFNVYDGSGAEMDWNHFMIPAPDFEFLITDALPYKGGSGTFCLDDDWHSCVGENDCMEGELTPDQSFYENPWFPKSTGESVLEGQQICMYGPWIRECVHGHRPEIHTAEQTWWKEKWRDADLYWLLALQDDSNRFDEEDEFDIEGTVPDEWRPWAAAPMTARFQIAFEVNPAGPALHFEIGEAFAHNIVTSLDPDSSVDADNGADHAIEYNGEIVLTANENQPKDADLGVTFTDVCRQANERLRGYVTITTKMGVNNDGDEGYHVLFVTGSADKVTRPIPVPPEFRAKAVILTTADPNSMRRLEIDGRPQLVGDLRAEIEGLKVADPDDTAIDRMEIVAPTHLGQELVYQADPKAKGGLVKGLRLFETVHLAFTTQAGARIESVWPGLSVAVLIDEQVSASSDALASSWPVLVKAAGGSEASAPQGLHVKRTREAQLSAAIQYAMRKEGRVSMEEGSPFVERLNEVVARGDEKDLNPIFGTNQPFEIVWTFEATNLRTGASVPVGTRTAAATKDAATIVVNDVPAKFSKQTIRIAFPEGTDEVYEVRAKAKVTDVFGSASEIEHRVWSHFIADGTGAAIVRPLLPTVAAAAGVAAEDLLAAASLGKLPLNDPRLRDPKVRRGLVVHNFAMQAADDARISIGELGSLISGAKLLGPSSESPK